MSGDCTNNKFMEEAEKLAQETGALKPETVRLFSVQTSKVTSIKPAMKARGSLVTERSLAEFQIELTELEQRIGGVHQSLAEKVTKSLKIKCNLDSAKERQRKAVQRLVECGESVPASVFKSLSLLQESYLNAVLACVRLDQRFSVAECEISALEDKRDQLAIDVRRTRENIKRLTDESAQFEPVFNDMQIKRAA